MGVALNGDRSIFGDPPIPFCLIPAFSFRVRSIGFEFERRNSVASALFLFSPTEIRFDAWLNYGRLAMKIARSCP